MRKEVGVEIKLRKIMDKILKMVRKARSDKNRDEKNSQK